MTILFILVIAGSSYNVTTQEFATMDKCTLAKDHIKLSAEIEKVNISGRFLMTCEPK